MALNGIWATELYGIYGWESTGILVLHNGHVLGGGNNHYSVGTCEEVDGKVTISMDVKYHGQVRTLFGESRDSFSVRFRGDREGLVITGILERPDRDDMAITCRLSRCSELPAALV